MKNTILGGKNFKVIRMTETVLHADTGVHAIKFSDELLVSKELYEAITEASVRDINTIRRWAVTQRNINNNEAERYGDSNVLDTKSGFAQSNHIGKASAYSSVITKIDSIKNDKIQ